MHFLSMEALSTQHQFANRDLRPLRLIQNFTEITSCQSLFGLAGMLLWNNDDF